MPERAAKTVLVTGAAKRLGRAIALALAEQGWDVAIHCNASPAEAEEVAAALRARGRNAAILTADLAKEGEAATLVPRAAEALGPLRGLVNNASLFENDTIASMTRASWDRHMAVNLRAPMVLTQAFAKQLPTDAVGSVVNLLDQRLLKPTPDFLSYGASKAGLGWLTLTLAQALAPRIRVNAVAPGPTLPSPRQSESHFRRQNETTILGHGASPDDIAAATCYLMSARAVTGQTITVDGGQHLIWKTSDTDGVTE
jgi:NAD(P)-dependent dehydrogenase (short-subunit alcohol dehydrogenase family)